MSPWEYARRHELLGTAVGTGIRSLARRCPSSTGVQGARTGVRWPHGRRAGMTPPGRVAQARQAPGRDPDEGGGGVGAANGGGQCAGEIGHRAGELGEAQVNQPVHVGAPGPEVLDEPIAEAHEPVRLFGRVGRPRGPGVAPERRSGRSPGRRGHRWACAAGPRRRNGGSAAGSARRRRSREPQNGKGFFREWPVASDDPYPGAGSRRRSNSASSPAASSANGVGLSPTAPPSRCSWPCLCVRGRGWRLTIPWAS